MAEKAVWDKENVKQFCDICMREVNARHRPLGHLNRVGWKNVAEKFEQKTGRKLEHLQLKNKWDALKRRYTIFMELKNATTGFGWNDEKQTVDYSEEWWNEHLARCDDPSNGRKCKHVQFRKRGSDNLEAMHIMFGSAHVTGASASIPGDLSDNCSDDEVHEVERSPSNIHLSTMLQQKGKKCKGSSSTCADDKEERSPFLRLYKETCSKIEDGVDKITSSIEASSAPYMTSHIPTLAEAMRVVTYINPKNRVTIYCVVQISEEHRHYSSLSCF
jgi:hypothetical protein